jgi:hypothetical protein
MKLAGLVTNLIIDVKTKTIVDIIQIVGSTHTVAGF